MKKSPIEIEQENYWIEATKREELDQLLMEVSAIFNGWHGDGTSWSDYDQSVYDRVTEYRKKYTYDPPKS